MSESVTYHGLVNQGATCGGLNSVLQVLCMTDGFKEKVIRSHTRESPHTQDIDRELSELFIQLERNTASARNITQKLKITNVNKQCDAAEFYENILRLTSPYASQMFHGEMKRWNKCQKCSEVTERTEKFWHLALPLQNTNDEHSVERGIESVFLPSVFTGDDQMYCDVCDDKCDAVLKCDVECYPEVLVLLVKRFEFDFTRGECVKIARAVDVPYILRVQEENYRLYGIVKHLNERESGRYIATVWSRRDGRWHTFDDAHVSVSGHQHFQTEPTERSSTAYLLFYQRATAAIRYNGLLNLGATCYLNSVLQVLFMTQGFRLRVSRYAKSNPETEGIDRELGELFSELERRQAYTFNIIRKLRISNVDEQRDAAEHYEKILRLTSREASQVFHGELQNNITCKTCTTETTRVTGFWLLPLSLMRGRDSVNRSLLDFKRSSMKMYCVDCKEERWVELNCDVKNAPDVLVILLKRFEYDDGLARNVKNNSEVAVPFGLRMQKTYELYACVEHIGELQFGHYFSRIRSQDDGRWYIFDDMNVTEIRDPFQDDRVMRSHTAYLLFYQKKKDEDDASAAQETEESLDKREKAQRTSDEAETNEEVIHKKQQTTERDQHQPQEDQEEETEDGQDSHLTHDLDHGPRETPHPEVDRLAEDFNRMNISDQQDPQCTPDAAGFTGTQPEGPDTEGLVQQEHAAQNLQFEDDMNKGAGANGHVCARENIMDVGRFEGLERRPHDQFENSYSASFYPEEQAYKLKLTVRSKELDSQGKYDTSKDSAQDQDKEESKGSGEGTLFQPYKVHYPEDLKRIRATKSFIWSEEQSKNEEVCSAALSGSFPGEMNKTLNEDEEQNMKKLSTQL